MIATISPVSVTEAHPFRQALVDAGLLFPSDVPGVYGRGAAMEAIVAGLDAAISGLGSDDGTSVIRFPPVMSRAMIERGGYLRSFPHLLGTVHCFEGDDAGQERILQQVERGEDWGGEQRLTDLVLAPAACYPIYPASAGTLPAAGRLLDVSAYCFRHEASPDPARMQAFRMREFVRLADPATVEAWRDQWQPRALQFLRDLGLDPRLAPANDPFFGRGGRLLAASQAADGLKLELLVPTSSDVKLTAVMSLNYHREHFGETFAIRTADGAIAHSACTAFGMERIALALVRAHGVEPGDWPAEVRARLRLAA
jgi:seryl-tRNA synthetase